MDMSVHEVEFMLLIHLMVRAGAADAKGMDRFVEKDDFLEPFLATDPSSEQAVNEALERLIKKGFAEECEGKVAITRKGEKIHEEVWKGAGKQMANSEKKAESMMSEVKILEALILLSLRLKRTSITSGEIEKLLKEELGDEIAFAGDDLEHHIRMQGNVMGTVDDRLQKSDHPGGDRLKGLLYTITPEGTAWVKRFLAKNSSKKEGEGTRLLAFIKKVAAA